MQNTTPETKKKSPALKLSPEEKVKFNSMVDQLREALATSTTLDGTSQAISQIILHFVEEMGWDSPDDNAKGELLRLIPIYINHKSMRLPKNNPQGHVLDYSFRTKDILKLLNDWTETTFGKRFRLLMPTLIVDGKRVSKKDNKWYIIMQTARWHVLQELLPDARYSQESVHVINITRKRTARQIATGACCKYLADINKAQEKIQDKILDKIQDEDKFTWAIEKSLMTAFEGEAPDAIVGYAYLYDNVMAAIDIALAQPYGMSVTKKWWPARRSSS